MQWDMYMGAPLKRNPKAGQPVPGSSVGRVPIIRMYGVNDKDNSAVVNVHGFTPYFYCKAPPYDCPTLPRHTMCMHALTHSRTHSLTHSCLSAASRKSATSASSASA